MEMAEEEKKQEEVESQNEELNQEDLAKEWEEALKQQSSSEGEKSQEELAKEWEEALKQQQASTSYGEEKGQEDLAKEWEEALKQQSSEKEKEGCEGDFDILRDIPLEVSVEIGSAKLPLEEVLKLHTNSVVELDRFIEEPVDIKINGKLFAKGKLYQVGENFGIEIVQIVTPEERLKLIEE